MSTDVEQIELTITEARAKADRGDALERLTKNADFQQLVMVGYFEKEAINLVQQKAHPAMQKPEAQAVIVRRIDAIGDLYQYFTRIDIEADLALASIADAEAELSAMAEEGVL